MNDVDILHRLASELPPNATVIDLGGGTGATALAILEKRLDDVIVYSVDTDQAALRLAAQAIKSVGRLPNWRAVPLSVETAGRWYKGPPPSLLLYDAAVTRAAVDRALRIWIPKLPSATPVWVNRYRAENGVTRAVDRLVREGLLLFRRLGAESWYGSRR